MSKLESMIEHISSYMTNELNYDEEQRAVINYGILSLIQMLICIFLVVLFGVIFNVTIEALIISFIGSILRKSSGGAHAKTPSGCAIIGTIVTVGMALIAKQINIGINFVVLIGVIIFMWSYYIVYKFAPVDSIAKPIKKIEKRKRLKKSSIIILSIYLIIVMLNILSYFIAQNNRVLTYTFCIYMGLLWQVFSLTNMGYKVIGSIGQ